MMLNKENLHKYQRAAVSHIIEHPSSGLFLDMGLGKTVSTLTAMEELIYDRLTVGKVLIIAPKRVAESVWKQEAEKWQHLRGLRFSMILGAPKKRMGALQADADIYVMSRDSVLWLFETIGIQKVFDTLVIDELSSFKNHGSKRFKALRKMRPNFSRVIGLTGTPTPNTLLELWPQMYLLDMGERLCKTLTNYRDLYFKPGARNGHIIYGYDLIKGSEDKIQKKISDICMSMKSTDYLDMPDLIHNEVLVDMPKKVSSAYQDFEMTQVLKMMEGEDDTSISAVNAAVLSNKLLQYADGAVYFDEKSEGYEEYHEGKLDALEEILDTSTTPILLAWCFQHSRDRILKRFKFAKELKSDKDILDWNAGKIKLLIMHPASGGHGLNLQKGGSTIVWFSQTWSLELYQQLNARLYRQGQTSKTVIIHHLVAKGTMDEDVLKALSKKDRTQEALLSSIKHKIKKYAKL